MVSCRFSCKPPMRWIFLSFCLKQRLCTIRHAVLQLPTWRRKLRRWNTWLRKVVWQLIGSRIGSNFQCRDLVEDFYDPCWFLLSLKASIACKDQDLAPEMYRSHYFALFFWLICEGVTHHWSDQWPTYAKLMRPQCHLSVWSRGRVPWEIAPAGSQVSWLGKKDWPISWQFGSQQVYNGLILKTGKWEIEHIQHYIWRSLACQVLIHLKVCPKIQSFPYRKPYMAII